jgi:hypothetical protein
MNVLKQNISIIEWYILLMSFVCLSVLLVEGTEGPGENHRPVACHWQTLSHNVVHLSD